MITSIGPEYLFNQFAIFYPVQGVEQWVQVAECRFLQVKGNKNRAQ